MYHSLFIRQPWRHCRNWKILICISSSRYADPKRHCFEEVRREVSALCDALLLIQIHNTGCILCPKKGYSNFRPFQIQISALIQTSSCSYLKLDREFKQVTFLTTHNAKRESINLFSGYNGSIHFR